MTATTRQRTCIVCKSPKTKEELIRVVKSPAGEVSLDASGKKAGRGAYVCGADCFTRALEGNRFNAALKMKLSTTDKEVLANQLVELVAGETR